MVPRSLVAMALLCCACARERLSDPAPLVPDAPPAASSTARREPRVRSWETKTIGADRFPLGGAPTRSAGAESSAAAPGPRDDHWGPAPVYGSKNPSPPGPGTPLFGEPNPSPPGPGTPRYGDPNPSPPGPSTPRYGDPSPSPPGR